MLCSGGFDMSKTRPALVPLVTAIVLLMRAHPSAYAAEGWKTTEQRAGPDGWKLESRARPGSDFVEYRIVAELDATPLAAAKAARRLQTEPAHLPKGVQRTILREDADLIVSYSRFGLPGPLADRDVVLRIEAFALPSGAVGLRWKSAPELGPPPARGVVRMRESTGGWEFTPTDDGKVVAVGLMHGDLGGYIPAFLVNRLAGDSLVKNLGHIREMAAKRDASAKPN
jgi:hypothetical protein